jgi:hypothetical protein
MLGTPANLRMLLIEGLELETVRGSEHLAAGEADYLVWTATDSGVTSTLLRGAGDRYRVLGRVMGLWVAADGKVWRAGPATFRVPARRRCPNRSPGKGQ